MSLLHLPDEVLRHVAEYAGVAACFPLSSTCRSLHSLFRMVELRRVSIIFDTEMLSLDRIMQDCRDVTESLVAALQPCLQIPTTDRSFKILQVVVEGTPSLFKQCDRVHELQEEYGFLTDYGDNFAISYVGPRTFRGETLFRCNFTLLFVLQLVNVFMVFTGKRNLSGFVSSMRDCIEQVQGQVAALENYRAAMQPLFVQAVPACVFNQ